MTSTVLGWIASQRRVSVVCAVLISAAEDSQTQCEATRDILSDLSENAKEAYESSTKRTQAGAEDIEQITSTLLASVRGVYSR